MLEKKKLNDGSDSLNIYFVQKDKYRVDSIDIINSMDKYLQESNIFIEGYKEFNKSLPIDPTTLKPKTFDVTGFVKYKNNKKYNVSYIQEGLDTYKLIENH